MRSSKSRSRSKQNRPRSIGNIVNRVFDSSGPEGKVRGTPQQIIEKYQTLARDAQLSNDRVAAENFLQHAEHYTRMLGEAMRELAAEQEARRQVQGSNGNGNGNGHHNGGHHDRQPMHQRRDERAEDFSAQPEIETRDSDLDDSFAVVSDVEDSGLVETPETRVELVEPEAQSEAPRREASRAPYRDEQPRRERYAPRPRAERAPRVQEPRVQDEPLSADQQPAPSVEAAADALSKEAPKPRRPRAPRKPAGSAAPTAKAKNEAAE